MASVGISLVYVGTHIVCMAYVEIALIRLRTWGGVVRFSVRQH